MKNSQLPVNNREKQEKINPSNLLNEIQEYNAKEMLTLWLIARTGIEDAEKQSHHGIFSNVVSTMEQAEKALTHYKADNENIEELKPSLDRINIDAIRTMHKTRIKIGLTPNENCIWHLVGWYSGKLSPHYMQAEEINTKEMAEFICIPEDEVKDALKKLQELQFINIPAKYYS